MSKKAIIYIILFITSSLNVLKATDYQLVDQLNGKQFSIRVEFLINPNNNFNLFLVDGKNILDSLCYDGLLYEGIVSELENKNWLKIKLPLKAGMGTYLEKTILIQSHNGKLNESLHITSRLDQSHSKELEAYKVNLNLQHNKMSLKESTTYKGQNEWELDKLLYYDSEFKVFCSSLKTLTGVKVHLLNDEVVGKYPIIEMKNYTYVFVDEKWYMLGDNNILYPDWM